MRPAELARGARIYGPFGRSRNPRLELLSTTRIFAWGASAVAAALLGGLVLFLVVESIPVLLDQPAHFLAGAAWSYPHHRFGALAMIFGTVAVSALALVVALPLGLGTAVVVAEYLPRRARAVAKSLLELLAAVPSVVYGLLGVLYLRVLVRERLAWLDPASGDSLATAGLLLAVMVLPTLATLAEDALDGVPQAARDAARALGMTRPETVRAAVLPHALPGLVGAALLGLGRALGETMAVYLVVGRSDGRLPAHPFDLGVLFDPGQTLTSKLGSPETALAIGDPLHWSAVVGLGLVLFVLVGVATLSGDVLLRGRRR